MFWLNRKTTFQKINNAALSTKYHAKTVTTPILEKRDETWVRGLRNILQEKGLTLQWKNIWKRLGIHAHWTKSRFWTKKTIGLKERWRRQFPYRDTDHPSIVTKDWSCPPSTLHSCHVTHPGHVTPQPQHNATEEDAAKDVENYGINFIKISWR